MSSPAERYARSRAASAHPALTDFRGAYSFELDAFQIAACEALEDGHGVLVAAPTGSGKTLVGEFAVHLALSEGRKCFYTTPIKALSNQKFQDLAERYGVQNVGLLTGDTTINGEAPVVVMTTEVLRNMLYAHSTTLESLGYVVMDEVHYLADRFRGAVWEEVIIHLPDSVSVVSLSATVSNAEEFGDWLGTVRGDTVTIVEESRPVPLYQHVMVGRRMLDLFEDGEPALASEQDGDGSRARVNRQLETIAREEWRAKRVGGGSGRGRNSNRRGRGDSYAASRSKQKNRTPTRVEVLERLDAAALLPAIVFVFSRAGCAAAVQQCLSAGVRLTSPDEEREIRELVAAYALPIPDDDLHVLGFHDFTEALARGIAAHHAGLLPSFKECVEELFSRGLVKVVFATETLALGINMPARSVVLERLSKWNGETHADITPGEYTQLTGRAGRRGIDVEGHGVVLWQPGLDPRQVAGLASTRTYPLRSSFRPSYNMAVNLVGQVGRTTAREMLESSFAQFQADRSVVGLARQVRKAEEALEGYAEAATCDRGDVLEYVRLQQAVSDLEKSGKRRRRASERESVVASLAGLRRGDVIEVPRGKWRGTALVLDPGSSGDRDEPRPLVLTVDRHARRLSMTDFPVAVEAYARVRVPKTFNHRDPASRRDLASALRERTRDLDPSDAPQPDGRARRGRQDDLGTVDDPKLAAARSAVRDHPVHGCPDREDHLRWARRYAKLERDTVQQRSRIEGRTNTIARDFDRVCEVLDRLGYLDGDVVTTDGGRLARIYSELDLVAGECLRHGVWDDLDPTELAAVLSGLTYEARAADDLDSPRWPTTPLREAASRMNGIWADLDRVEREHKVSFQRRPDFGFVGAAWQWARGEQLDDVLGDHGLQAGDFVRSTKMLLDVIDQVASAAGPGDLRTTARQASDLLRRGVVAYSSVSA